MFPSSSSRRSSTTSLRHSLGGRLDTSTSNESETVFESSQNAISTLLQPPIVRTGLRPHTSAPASMSHKAPTARDIPPVTLSPIKNIESAEFEPYVQRVGAIYEQLQRLKEAEDEGPESGGTKPDASPVVDAHLLSPRRTSMPTFDDTPRRPSYRRGSGSSRRKGQHGPPPLSTIPDVYFDQDFHLENPRTFDVVSERSDVVSPNVSADSLRGEDARAPRKTLATNAILQEKLSWYMDAVEVSLISSISTASTVFFSALGSLRELHVEAGDSVEKIQILRKNLQCLDEDIVSKGLESLRRQQVLRNLGQLNDAVLQLKMIKDGVSHIESLVDEGEVEKALTEINSTELLMAGKRAAGSGEETPSIQLRDLRGAAALQGVENDMASLRARIGQGFETKIQEALLADLRNHVQSVSAQEVLARWESSSRRVKGGHPQESPGLPAYMLKTDELRSALLPSVSALYRSKSISVSAVIQAYRESVMREIRNIVRRPLPSSDDDTESVTSSSTMGGGRTRTNQQKSSTLARNLRALDAEDAEHLLKTIFIGVAEALRRLKTQSNVFLDIACAIEIPDGQAESPSKQMSNGTRDAVKAPRLEVQEEVHTAFDLSNLLGRAVDVSHEKINKILRVRSEQSTNLTLNQFLRYFTLNLFFANECEAISGRSGTSLKTIVDSHIQGFIQAHKEREIQALAQGMSVDNWQVQEFAAKHDETLKQVLECSTTDPPAWTHSSSISAPLPQEEGHKEVESSENNATDGAMQGAVIEGETFLLPRSAILCLEGVSHFLWLMTGIPSMTPDIAASLVSYLQMFDSRCRQLILGAGALRSAGLKNITTTHLALASLAVSFIATIIPYIREFVRRHTPSGRQGANQITSEFDNARRALQEHQQAIYQKTVDIMVSRAGVTCKKIRDTKWTDDTDKDVRKYIMDLVRDTSKLYKALSKYLSEDTVKQVMVPVFNSYKDQLGEAFKEADPETEAGRECMVRDVEHLVHKLDKIEGFGDLGTHLTGIIEGKKLKEPEKKDAAEPKESEPESSQASEE